MEKLNQVERVLCGLPAKEKIKELYGSEFFNQFNCQHDEINTAIELIENCLMVTYKRADLNFDALRYAIVSIYYMKKCLT